MTTNDISNTNDTLDKDLAWFEENRARLFKEHPEKWIAVKDGKVLAIGEDASTTFREGATAAGTVHIMLKQILEKDPVFKAPAYTAGLLRAYSS